MANLRSSGSSTANQPFAGGRKQTGRAIGRPNHLNSLGRRFAAQYFRQIIVDNFEMDGFNRARYF
jgi:hypothetical protein